MPKKEEPKEISEDESELEEALEEDELEEIAEKVSDEDSTGEIIDDNQFREFLKPSSESFSPVLERVETPRQELLEQGVGSAPQSNTDNNDDPFKYNVQEGQEEPKYTTTSTLGDTPERIDIGKAGRSQTPFTTQEARLTESTELKGMESRTQEKYMSPERIDIKKAGRENPFEKEIKKYEIK